MIDAAGYVDAVTQLVLGGQRPNDHQVDCISHSQAPDLMIVAGPGSGKTTVLVLRALRHVIVDGVLPEEVLITTFTKKAAGEIRSRLISWGIPLFEHFQSIAATRGDVALSKHLALCDVNGFMTGTLDSLCEKWAGLMRRPGDIPPVMIESFAARQVYSRAVFAALYRDTSNKEVLDKFLSAYTWEQVEPASQGEAVEVAKSVIDRLVQDRADVARFANDAAGPHPRARALLAKSLTDLHALMRMRGQYDFALLEAEFLRKLDDPELVAMLALPKVLLIDEYQDTNPLQEAIYFRLATLARAAMTIVGDDDQALYRFRGATVELFRDFRVRLVLATGRPEPATRFLVDNYRSTAEIVSFFNGFIANDPQFLPARVAPPKPLIVASGSNRTKQMPILGMFRPSIDVLATDLATFVHDIFRGRGRTIEGTDLCLQAAAAGGDCADAVFMAHSVNEFGRPFMGKPGKERLPWLLRQKLAARGISIFNPRGRALKDIPEVQRLLGLVCLCIDPDGAQLRDLATYWDTKNEISKWRQAASDFIALNPVPNQPHTLASYVDAWRRRKPQASGMGWPREWPVLDLLYKVLAWLPEFQNMPEYQVYLEAITRSVTQAMAFSPYQGRLMQDSPHDTRSRDSVLRDILAPIAENVVEVDEELLLHQPRKHLNVMTIHQSKGLEFPLVIVDIGSDFSRNSPQQRFKRFPEQPSNVARMEDDFRPYTEVGALRMRRSSMERTFEDLIRLNYVAFSRPQTALVLVGHTNMLKYTTSIRNVATFWQQSGVWPWQLATPRLGKKPPASVSDFGVKEI